MPRPYVVSKQIVQHSILTDSSKLHKAASVSICKFLKALKIHYQSAETVVKILSKYARIQAYYRIAETVYFSYRRCRVPFSPSHSQLVTRNSLATGCNVDA